MTLSKEEIKLKKQQKREAKRISQEQREKLEQPLPKIESNTGAKTAFVVGNGTSRSTIDIHALHNHGVVFGCNGLYRQHRPDYLIAVDVKMILEINKEGYNVHNEVWTNYNKAFENLKNLNYFKPSKGWSSGPTALNMSTEKGFKTIYILGFDYKGLQDGRKFNNMYADTNNYKRSSDGATYYGNWLKQTKTVIEQNPTVQYVRVVDHDTFMPPELSNLTNLRTMKKEAFIHLFNNKL